MITESYRGREEAIFSPGAFLGERGSICDTAVATFSCEIESAVLEKYAHREVGRLGSVNGKEPIHLLDIDGRSVVFYKSPIGSSMAANMMIEAQWLTGFRRIVIFGSAGSLDSAMTTGKYVIPTKAYRDEGMSYHYAPPSDFIDIKNAGRLSAVFEKLSLPHVEGAVWTTDAFYRETPSAIEERRQAGCIAVEMELAGVQAVCDHHGIELYSFLVTGDVLDKEEYDARELSSANHSLDKFDIAVKILESI